MNVALDLDGTLISCEPRQSAVLRAALLRSGELVDLKRVWELKREGESTENALIKLGLKLESARKIACDWQRMIEDPFWLGLDTVLPGVKKVLQAMRKTGIQICLLTARSRAEWVPQQLSRLGLLSLLDNVIVVPAKESSKAKATVLTKASPAAFFGDTESDWQASLVAGVSFYGIATGQRSATFLKSNTANVYCDMEAAWNALQVAIYPATK
jgi:phosphoglycolate phosphatase-like HAD superfamily hydrolase